MLLGYNTNGLAHHDLLDAIALLAEIGYRGVAITLDHGALNPYDERHDAQLEQVADCLAKRALALRDRNRRPLPARPANQARADARHQPTRPAGRGESTFSAGRSTSRPG